MHSYLRSIGFSTVAGPSELEKLLNYTVDNFDVKNIAIREDGKYFVEFSKEYACDCGMTVCGELDENGAFLREYYFPYYKGSVISSQEPVSIEKKMNEESFIGSCDDVRLEISLIFYINDPAEYLKFSEKKLFARAERSVSLSALAETGMVLLPVLQDMKQKQESKTRQLQRNARVAAARNGDEEAIENLAMEEMDIYSMIAKRVRTEDVYTIVESYFMPFGLESDVYQIMGEIKKVYRTENSFSEEVLYEMEIDCNGIPFDVCINAKDLEGVPEPGRRFKGNIWLQGHVYF